MSNLACDVSAMQLSFVFDGGSIGALKVVHLSAGSYSIIPINSRPLYQERAYLYGEHWSTNPTFYTDQAASLLSENALGHVCKVVSFNWTFSSFIYFLMFRITSFG